MVTLRRRIIALVVATFALAAPVSAQSAGSYQKEPMFPDLVSVGHLSPSPSQLVECGNDRYRDPHQMLVAVPRVSANDLARTIMRAQDC
jgi:hypothetical protein